MRTMSSALQIARRVLQQDKAWLFFVELEAAPGSFFRLVKSRRATEADGKVWQPASIEIELPGEDADGSLGELAITLPNVSRVPMAYVEVDHLILGADVTVYLQHEQSLAAFEPSLSWEHVVLSARATERSMRLQCGHPAEIHRVPRVRFERGTFPQLLPAGGF